MGKAVWFFNLDIERDGRLFHSQENFVRHLAALTGEQQAYIFIDEIQRLENAGLFLKGLYDRSLPYKLVVTGSGSLELKEKISESLVGRKRNFFLPTVSMAEWAAYATDYRFDDRLPQLLDTDSTLSERLLEDYLTFGGYPRVCLAGTEKEKNRLLADIYQSYIERDISNLLRLEKTSAFVTLLQLIANRTGQLINYQDLSRLTGLSAPTLKDYLWYSEKTYVINAISPFFRNKDKEIVKSPQYYFQDIGLRNYLRGIFHDIADRGMRFQHLIFQLLTEQIKDSIARIHYWRTKSQAEVDFVINYGHRLLPVEVKAGQLKKPAVSRSFRSFIEKYEPPEAWIVNRSYRNEINIGQTKVRFRTWYDLL